MGLGLRGRLRRLKKDGGVLVANLFRQPSLFDTSTTERVGAVFREPSDMCIPDRMMLYALVRGLRPERTLEVGVRWGAGARIIAAALEDGGAGRAVGLDPEP